MKACPGLRSGIDRSGSLSFAIRGIPSPIRPPIRHSGEGRNPEGEGIVARGLVPRLGRAASSPALHHPAPSHFHPLMWPSQGHRDSGESRFPDRGRSEEGWHQPHPNTSNDQVSFSYLGVPAPAGLGEYYENSRFNQSRGVSHTPERRVH